MARLGEVCEINPKMPSFNDETLVSFVTMSDVSENGQINTSITRLYGEVKKGFTCFQEGDVLFAKITPCMENGKGALAIGLKNGIGCGSTEFHVLRSNPHVLDNRWLYYLTAHSAFRKEAERHMTGSAGQKRVTKSFLEKHEFTVPSLDEQRQHVKTLDLLENTIDLRKKQLQKLDDLVKSRFVDMFGDETNPKGWLLIPVESVADVSVGVVIKPAQYYTDSEHGVKAFRSLNIGPMEIKNSDWVYFSKEGNEKNAKTQLKENDLLIVRSGAPGTACVVTKEFEGCNAIDIIIARPNTQKINPYFLCYYTNLPHGKRQIEEGTGGAAQQHFNVGKYNKLKVMLPPMDKQNEFVTFVKHVDSSRLTIQNGLNKMELLKQSLMQKYFG